MSAASRPDRRDDIRQGIGNDDPVFLVERNLHLIGIVCHLLESWRELIGKCYVRTHQHSAAGNGADRSRKLNRRGSHSALTDTYRDGLARIPLLLKVLDLPFFRRHHAGNFLGQVNTGLLSQPEHGGVFCDAGDTQLLREGVEIRVARLIDRLADADRAVGTVCGSDPALKEAAIESLPAAAIDDQVLCNAFLQSGGGHDDLKHGTGSELRLDRFIQKRLTGIGNQPVPLIARDAHGKLIGIECRAADHREDFAVARVHRHNSPGFAFERLFGGDLQIKIDGELELFAGNRGHVAEGAHFLATTVDQHLARAVLAHQNIVVVLLDPRHADDVARVVQLPLRLSQHVFAHLADVADNVGHESVAGIEAAVNGDGVELGQLRFVRFDKGQLVGSDVVFEEQRLIARHSGHALQAGTQLVGGNVQSGGDLVGVYLEIAVLIAQQQHGERGIVVNDDAAFAVKDLAARRQNGDLLDAVLFGQGAVVIAARHLQAPQPEGQHQKNSQQDVLHCGKPELGDFFVATEHQELQLSKGYRCKVSKLTNRRAIGAGPATLL